MALIRENISSDTWPNNSIIIACSHGLPSDDYRCMVNENQIAFAAGHEPDAIRDDQWVNCSITWIRSQDGNVQAWVQPKIRPAWVECNLRYTEMFCGKSVYVFEGHYANEYPCRFASLICFDWVAAVPGEGRIVWQELLVKLNELFRNTQPDLDWLFVPQHNEHPNHPLFLNSTYNFLTDVNYPFVFREKAVVIHANTAVAAIPKRKGAGAFTACVFSPNSPFVCTACLPTVCMQPSLLRGSNALDRCKDIVFREMGECIHAFRVRVPRCITPDASDRAYPIMDARVNATHDLNDPRLSGGSIPASVKWLNDSLDQVESLSKGILAGMPLESEVEDAENSVRIGVRRSDAPRATLFIDMATCGYQYGTMWRKDERRQNIDKWDRYEENGLEHVVHTLSSLQIAYELEVADATLHGVLQREEGFIEVISIRGDTHEDCRRYYDTDIQKPLTDPVLLVVRDRHNVAVTGDELRKFYDSDVHSSVVVMDYCSLAAECRLAADKSILRKRIDDVLQRDVRII